MEQISERTVLYGSGDEKNILIQLSDRQEPENMEQTAERIQRHTKTPFALIACEVEDWNRDLSPWPAPPVFGKEAFQGEAEKTLSGIEREILTPFAHRTFLIGGYSLAGFFALWAAYRTDAFGGVAAVSPSVWYPGWTGFAKEHTVKAKRVYLSLGEKEERTKNPVMATVGNCIRTQKELLDRDGITSTLEWNPGGHFSEPEERTARGFAWLLEQM